MPRASRQQTDRNRHAIERVSSRLFRERGLHGVSVAEVMAAAGLTHGGFYGHFGSKDELAARACDKGFESSARRWNQRFAELADAPARRQAYVDAYLSAANRDRPGQGCTAAALAADVARSGADAPVRASYRAGLRAMAARLAELQSDAGTPAARQRALAEMATLVGALVLARASRGDPLSDEILAAARAALLGATGAGA